MTPFILILFLKWGYAGGVTQITYPDEKSCQAALSEVRHMESFLDASCVRGPTL